MGIISRKKRAVIYARFSSHNQRSESIEIQVEKSMAYCLEHGLEVVRIYQDAAKSGRNTARRDFQTMLEDAKRGLFDYVVIYKVTRIMRNRDEMALARIVLRSHGVEILYAGESIAEGSSGVLQLGMLEVLAEWESAQMAERIYEGIQKNAERCMANGHVMYGWDIVDGRYMVNESERRVLATAKDIVLSGGLVADAVRACGGHRTKRGAEFTQAALTKMLKREQNAGVYSYAGHRVEGGMPALWGMDEQEALWKVLGDRHRPRKVWSEHRYALTGKLYCGKCGRPMTGTSGTSCTGTTYYYYRCRKCGRKVRRDVVEADVAGAVVARLGDPGVRERIADLVLEVEEEEAAPRQSELISDEIRGIEVTFERIWQAIEDGIAPPGGKERIDELVARKEVLEEELRVAEAVESVRLDRDRVLFWLDGISSADAGTVIDVFVSRVVLLGDDLHVGFSFDGDVMPLEAFEIHGGEFDPLVPSSTTQSKGRICGLFR